MRAGGAERPTPGPTAYLGLAVGALFISPAAILVRLAQAPPLTAATYRVGLAWLLLLPLAWLTCRGELAALLRRHALLALASGLALAFHFALWIASLDYTTVASSVVMVNTNPIIVALFAWLFLRERVGLRVIVGILLGLAGTVAIGWGDLQLGPAQLWGDLLALLGAVSASSYLAIGRGLRARLSLTAYITLVYGSAGLFLLLATLAWRSPLTGLPGRSYIYLLLLALLPQLVGHSSVNWALKHVRAAQVAAAIMAEPVIASLLAWLVLGEVPPATTAWGGALVLAGVYLALRRGQGLP